MATSFRSKVGMAAFNIVVALTGITLFVAGIWLKLSSGLLHDDAITLFNSIEYNNIKLGFMLNTICMIMMILGALMILAAILGMCGAWKMVKGCIVLYMLLVILIMLTQAILVGLQVSYHTKTDQWLRGRMLKLLTTYGGPDSTDDTSEGWNALFMNARCCGVNDQYDEGGTNNDFSELSTTWWASNKQASEKLPANCCQGVTESTVSEYKNTGTCTNVPTNFYETGCWYRVKRTSLIFLIIICVACFLAIVAEITSLILGCVVMDNAKNRIRSTGPIRGPHKPAPPYVGIESVLKKH